MALKEETKHVAVKMIELSFNCNYLIKRCVRRCNYICILIIIEHNRNVSSDNYY